MIRRKRAEKDEKRGETKVSKKRPILHGLPRPSIQHRPDDNVVINRSKSVRDARSLPLLPSLETVYVLAANQRL